MRKGQGKGFRSIKESRGELEEREGKRQDEMRDEKVNRKAEVTVITVLTIIYSNHLFN